MGVSKYYIDTNKEPIDFNPGRLADALRSRIPEIGFAYLMGSASSGHIRPHSDLDLALYLNDALSLPLLAEVQKIVEEIVGNVRADIGILNRAEPVYRFESLKGRLLFKRDESIWLDFYSLACREYESQMHDYERQRRYRREIHT